MLRLTIALASILAVPAFAGEFAVLSSGMTIHIDRHEESSGTVRLYRGQTVTEMPRTMVTSFEVDEAEAIPTPAAVAQPAGVPQAAAVPQPAALAQAAPQASAPPEPKPTARELVKAAAIHAGLPTAFVESVAKTESGFDIRALSPKGAIGVMQLMPNTAKALGADPNDPAQNIEAGARLLRDLLIKYNGDVVKALAAYNAGEAAVDRYQGVPPFPETQHYVNTVVRDYVKGTAQ